MYNLPAPRTSWLHKAQLGPCPDLNHPPHLFKGNQTVTLQDPEPISHRLRLKQNPPITFLVAFPAFVPAHQSRNESAKAKIRKMTGASPTGAFCSLASVPSLIRDFIGSYSTLRMGWQHVWGTCAKWGAPPRRQALQWFWSQQIRFQPQLYVQMTPPFQPLIFLIAVPWARQDKLV